MDLKTFVSETITQIIDATVEAQEHARTKGAKINPALMANNGGPDGGYFSSSRDGQPAQMINFDVALTITEGRGAQGSLGVFVGSVGVGTRGDTKNENSSVSRVQFSIPLMLPIEGETNSESYRKIC